jgi:GNAT superfamily N-acetyltransferase
MPSDADTIVRFNVAMAAETEGIALKREIISAGVRGMFDDPSKGFYLIAELAGKPAGQLMITMEWSDWRDGYFWWIQSVYVDPGCRKRGVFTALFGRVRQDARKWGACGIRLYVFRANARAKVTYESLGMKDRSYDLYEMLFKPM